MSQSQLLTLMNGPRGTPMPPPVAYPHPPPPPPHMQGQYRAFFPPPPVAPQMAAYGMRTGPLSVMHRQGFGAAGATPLSAPAMSPGFPVGAGGPPNPALLSILNGRR
jgi:hypothetical protein